MQYRVAVRALCDFTARRGDLDLRFTPSPSALEGIAGHRLVASRRGPEFESEINLGGSFGALDVRGRADGYDPGLHRLEEVKTHRGDLGKQPSNHRHLHWAQAKVYGWLLCQARRFSDIDLALTYFDIGTQEETVFVEKHSASSLQAFFEECCNAFLEWAERELRHRAERDARLTAMTFPHAAFRRGQRELAASVYRGATTGRCVLAQAPTGIGKTIATVFSKLKAAPSQRLDKILYLTAKSTGRRLALDAGAVLLESQPSNCIRILELTARDKACEYPDKACHGDSCPLARGFYDRLPAARTEALTSGLMDTAAVRAAALKHEVCPYYLGQELARWADMIVGDFNYWFDGSAMLYALALGNEWRVGVLVDEAHNLVERARSMYSATLAQASLRAVRGKATPPVQKALDKVNRSWATLRKLHGQPDGLAELPESFLNALKQAGEAIEAHLAESPAGTADASLQQAYFDILAFGRLAESFGAHSVLEVAHEDGSGRAGGTTVSIRNLIPASFLKPRFAAARSVTLFSATLNPPDYQIDMLGLPADTVWIDVESPFSAEQLDVQVIRSISTRFADRQRSVSPIVSLIAEQFARRPGNYLAFFSSFDYLGMVAAEFGALHPGIPMWTQERGMNERDRNEFIARFKPDGAGLGFAVLGGSFGEGIDLRGDRLVGAFIATLGLPQVNPRNELLRERLHEEFGRGYDYAYLFPGIQKVVQAAGRVIRTQEDRGVLYLIDDRFARPDVRVLLPSWWDYATPRRPNSRPIAVIP